MCVCVQAIKECHNFVSNKKSQQKPSENLPIQEAHTSIEVQMHVLKLSCTLTDQVMRLAPCCQSTCAGLACLVCLLVRFLGFLSSISALDGVWEVDAFVDLWSFVPFFLVPISALNERLVVDGNERVED